MKKQYLDYAGLKRVLKRFIPFEAKPTCYDVDGNFVVGQKIVELTKAQYKDLAVKDPDTYYVITDGSATEELLPLRMTPEKWPKNQKIVFDENTFGYRFYRAPGSADNPQGQQTGNTLVPMDDITNWAIIQSGGSFQRSSDKSWHDINTYSTGNIYFCLWPMSGVKGLSFYSTAAGVFKGVDTWCIVSKNTGN